MGSLDYKYSGEEHYKKLAKLKGFASRSVFKLIELDKKFKILNENDIVLDLGYWPGGWIKYCAKKSKLCIGIDIKEIKEDLLKIKNIMLFKKDIFDENIFKYINNNSKILKFDVVLSDMMANTTGQKDVDSYNSFLLSKRALDFAITMLTHDGFFVCKIFHGEFFDEFLKECRSNFANVKMSKPKSSRENSREVYVICKIKK